MESIVKKTLKTLCCNNGWSYGVFWRFDQRNSMLLTLEDAYYEEHMGVMIDNMLLQVHMLGQGIIGQTAYTGKHRWMFSDAHNGELNSLGFVGSRDIFQDDSEILGQFSSGIETIAVVSVETQGVVQFGSTEKILERLEFLDQVKRMFRERENVDRLTNSEIYDSTGLFASLISTGNSNYGNFKPVHDCKEITRKACSSTSSTQSPSFAPVMYGRMPPLMRNSSHFTNQLQPTGVKAEVILSNKPNAELQHMFTKSTTFSGNLASETPCNKTTWSREGSTLTSFEQELPSEMRVRGPPSLLFPAKSNTHVTRNNTVQSFQGDSTFTSLYDTDGLLNVEEFIEYSSGKLMDNQHSSLSFHPSEGEPMECSTSLHAFPEEFKTAEFTESFSKSYLLDDVSQWFAPSPESRITGLDATLNSDLLQEIGVTSVPSGLDTCSTIPVKDLPNPLQSSVSNTFIHDEKEKKIVPGNENMLDCLGLDFGCGQVGGSWEDIVLPVVSGGHSTISTGISECVSELDVGSMVGTQKGLFSELGLEQLLNDIVGNSHSVSKASFEDQLSTSKRRRTEDYPVSSNQMHLEDLSCPSGTMNSMPSAIDSIKANNLGILKEAVPKSQVGLWIGDAYSINTGSSAIAQPKRPEEPAKNTKKRARPGESTRPRPKDRQQIQDRIQELRKIIPNGAKSSIDSLLDSTIKHMLFLQSVTKYADKLRQVDEPKLVGHENGVVLKDKSSSAGGGGGATWAFEVGGQTMVCPIIVEDLNPPGQMLIEMLCEDRGFFLEIADIIRGFGLNILKGVMEIRENKIWARFTVEANKHITRMDIFWSLVQLLQQTATSEVDSNKQPSNVGAILPQINNYQQPLAPHPISLVDTLR